MAMEPLFIDFMKDLIKAQKSKDSGLAAVMELDELKSNESFSRLIKDYYIGREDNWTQDSRAIEEWALQTTDFYDGENDEKVDFKKLEESLEADFAWQKLQNLFEHQADFNSRGELGTDARMAQYELADLDAEFGLERVVGKPKLIFADSDGSLEKSVLINKKTAEELRPTIKKLKAEFHGRISKRIIEVRKELEGIKDDDPEKDWKEKWRRELISKWEKQLEILEETKLDLDTENFNYRIRVRGSKSLYGGGFAIFIDESPKGDEKSGEKGLEYRLGRVDLNISSPDEDLPNKFEPNKRIEYAEEELKLVGKFALDAYSYIERDGKYYFSRTSK